MLLLSFFSTAAIAEDHNTSELSGLYLEDALSHRLVDLGAGAPKLFVTSQPGCSACEAQIRDLACLPNETQIYSLILTPLEESSASDLKYLKKLKAQNAPALILPQHLKKAWSIGDATPEVLSFDATGKLKFKRIGLQTCDSLKD